MTTILMMTASILGFCGLILDAIGAHALPRWILDKALLDSTLSAWQTAVRYQLIHSVFILCLFSAGNYLNKNWQTAAALCALLGILVFSGSIYLKTLTAHPAIGKVTPTGGLLLMSSWLILCLGLAVTRFRGP